MTEIANTPELRFPNYENSWFSYKLNDISERVTRKNKNLESQRPLTISGQLGLIDQIEYFNKSVSSKNLTGYILIKKGEFAYNKSYSNGYPLGAIKKLERYDLGILSSLYICFSFDENIDKSFMKNYFESTKWYREVANIAVEGARNHGLLNIPVNDFFNININLPIQYEQEKIGEFFSKLDRQIELEEQKLEKLEEQKKGYMQQIFSQQLRFKDENGNEYPEWEEKKLGDILERGNKDKVNEIGKYRRLTISLHGKGLYEVKQERKTKDTRPFYQRFEGELIIGKQNFFNGSIAIVTREFNGFICSNAIMSYKISNHMNRKYLLEYLLQNDFLRKNEYLADGTGQKELSEKKFEELEIKLPNSINEQQKIGVFLERLDNLIEKQSNKLELLKQRKKSFLQKMFV
ncbi:restriction endonuclease subunit S [Staphylococcus haemolyticus]|uniref:restriction endonuclease subunit S n=1 Tax=Staphylococcus haemolyticus TaxID=1283 RepID=UPI001950271C|nr:restriction endonuclease subunit S [Staphylococcus haemolyticus]